MANSLAWREKVMKRGFTLVEVLMVIGIMVILAALSFPVFVNAKKAARRTACISNLRQIGVAITLYRGDLTPSDRGTPVEMGLPPDRGALRMASFASLQCQGNNPSGNGYYMTYPGPDDEDHFQELWARYVASYGSQSIIFFDPNHQESFPRSIKWDNWAAIGLRLDGSVFTRIRQGFPLSLGWWHN